MSSRRNSRGVTLIETVVSIVVLGVALPPLIALFHEIASHTPDDLHQRAALAYADGLMEEILSKEYEDPSEPRSSFGTEEVLRSSYDDVDDYDGMNNSPPRHLDGSVLGDYGGFTRSVEVHNVTGANPDPLAPEVDGSTALKRIRVTVAWTSGRAGEVTLTMLRAPLGSSDRSGPLQGPGSAGSAFNDDEKKFDMVLINETSTDLQIESFQFSSNRPVSPLKKFKLATEPDHFHDIWKGEEPVPTGTLIVKDDHPEECIIPVGGATGAHFEFDEDIPPGPITFTLVLNFTDGSSSILDIPFTWAP